MSELKLKIRDDIKVAMKAREKERTGALRMLLAAIQVEETSGTKHELKDQEILKVIAREIKKRKESAEVYAANGRQELADQELLEAAVLNEYLPQQLSDDEIQALVAQTIEELHGEGLEINMKSMGQIMKVVTERAAGTADGKRLSTAVRAALQ
ncbi:GatB/YqeY domain-containing protein [Corynebacterium sp. ES2794-CONJ1]|uniref:GatB/YqeY domain-containing protein n=1 Tax=unclassified Corynebacterium TaxID=2624378 RepID=UPI002167C724|nr:MULTISPECIES: GatB/YqeY domain-containing protein [unclassified Corynebacterium]MCS4492104.1 GatB/YqeY domain-containing protein [Corynebacterium sp. ES2715-CONJ3]MCS4532212.1 GatB/YqeY domain-containing protein [Corynebacterium sp. ES2730-CONJ]MCU9519608.1 GatB/YqeY domain-containing protein [Corynebacterium sp. ES2794-CONJ1]